MTRFLYSFGLIIAFIIFLMGAIFTFTMHLFSPKFEPGNIGSMGDAFAGFTAPLINIGAAYLVFKSFEAQREANEIQVKANKKQDDQIREERNRTNAINKFNQIISLIDDIEKLFLNFEVEYYWGTEPGPVKVTDEAAFKKIREYVASLKQGIAVSVRIRNMPRIRNNYTIFLKHLSFTSNAIAKYEYNEDSSKEILQMKFVTLVSEFQSIVAEIHSHSLHSSDQKFDEMSKFSAEFITNLQIIKKVIRATK